MDQNSLLVQFYSNLNNIFPNTQFFALKSKEIEDVEVDEKQKKPAKADIYPIEQKNGKVYNSDLKRFDIYFSPNGDFRGKRRKKENAGNIYCAVVDFDGVSKESAPREAIEFEPSIIIETFRGFHCYWLFKTPIVYDLMGKMWEELETNMCDFLGGDHQAKDVARIFRAPGYRYWKKGADGSFYSIIKKFDIDITHDFDDLYYFFKKQKDIVDQQTFEYQVKNKDYSDKMLFDDIQNSPVLEVLFDLYPQYSLHGDGVSLIESGRLTSGYKYNRKDNYVISFSGHQERRPEGGPFSVAKHYYKDSKAVFKYFKEKRGLEVSKPTIPDKQNVGLVDGVDEEGETGVSIFLGGSKKIFLSKTDRKIYKTDEDGGKIEILDAVIYPQGYYVKFDPKQGLYKNVHYIEYEKNGKEPGEVIKGMMFLDTLGAKNAIKTLLSKQSLTWVGSSKDSVYIERYIHDVRVECKVIDKLGYHGNGLLITKPGNYTIFHEGEKYIVDIGSIQGKGEENEVITIGEQRDVAYVMNMIKMLRETYYSPIATCMFLMFGIYIFVKDLRKKYNIPIPLTMITGVSQAGKTKLRETIQKMYGIFGVLATSAEATEFSVVAMSRHYTPLVVTEYDNKVVRFSWDHLLKNTFDTGFMTRGTAAQTVNTYELNCGFVIDGETGITTNSVRTRTIFMQAQKKYRKSLLIDVLKNEKLIKTEKEFDKVVNINKYFYDNAEKISQIPENLAKYKEIFKEKYKDLDKGEKDRVIENFSLIMAFAESFDLLDEDIANDIHKLCLDNIQQLGSDNIIKILRDILNTGMQYGMNIYLKNKIIYMEYTPNIHKFKDNKDQDTRSNILNINSAFFDNEENQEDLLKIPVDYLFSKVDAHRLLNTVLDYMYYDTRKTPDPSEEGELRLALRSYAEKNGYTHHLFYQMLDADHGDRIRKTTDI